MKTIVSIDGGGIRGMFSLQILKQIESLFRERNGNDSLVLADVVDLFAGTSTGAIIATSLSWGMSVDEVESLYLEHGSTMFTKTSWYRRWFAKYRAEKLADMFKEILVDGDGNPALLGTDRLRTLLLVVMRNASSGSTWPMTNNPNAMFNDTSRSECNLKIPLWQLVRGSTAAPTYFSPEKIQIGDEAFLFMDGGITPYNNPSLLAVLTATLPAYRIGWETGVDNLRVISVGTGGTRTRLAENRPERVSIFSQLGHVPPALLSSISAEQDTLCRILGRCLHGAELDQELGDLAGPGLLGLDQRKFLYVRYDTRLDVPDSDGTRPLLSQAKLDDLRLIPKLQEIGQYYASKHVRASHLWEE